LLTDHYNTLITEKFYQLTPYQYASNDPILNIDLDGLEGASSNDPRIIALSQKNVQDKINRATQTTRRAASVEVSVGVGIGVKEKVGKVGVDAGVNAASVSVSTNLAGEGKAKASVASAGVNVGVVRAGAETASAQVEFGPGAESGKITTNGPSAGVDADLSESKEIKAGKTTVAVGSDAKTGEVSFGIQAGIVGATISISILDLIKVPFEWMDALIEGKKTEIEVQRNPQKY
jgi:hypothetical protein